MNTVWLNLVGNLVVGLFIAVASAGLAVRFALKRFYVEKWWERRADTYIEIINALHNIKNHADQCLEAVIRDIEIPQDIEEELTEKLKKGISEIRRLLDIGPFLISEEAIKALSILCREMDDSTSTTNWSEHLELKLAAVNKCLKSIRQIAKADLAK